MIQINRLDDEVWGDITTALKQRDVVVALLVHARDVVGQHEDHTQSMLEVHRAELAQANADMQGLVIQSKQPGMPDAARRALTEELIKVGNQIEKLEAIIEPMESTTHTQEAYQTRVQQFADWVTCIADGLDTQDFAGKRRVLFMLGAQVFVSRLSDKDAIKANDGRRWKLQTDFAGLNLGARLGTDIWERYTMDGTNNNAHNYAILNALDLQELLGQPVGKGEPLPEAIVAARAAREAEQAAHASDAEETP